MSNIIDINEIRKQFAEKLSSEEWKIFADMQRSMMEKYEQQLDFLTQKNKHLENLLLKNSGFATEITPEETICVQQISRLETLSNERQLTLEEVKKLDLLVKNLKLVREESTIVVSNKDQAKLGENDLVAIIRSEGTEEA